MALANTPDTKDRRAESAPTYPKPGTTLMRKAHSAITIHSRRNGFCQKRAFFVEQTMADMSRRLTIREFVQKRLTIVSNIMCFLAVLGIVLMVIANELNFHHFADRDSKASWSIKLIITISTAILLVLLLYYHYLDLKLYSNQNALQDNRVGLTYRKIALIGLELLVCAVHPMPRMFPWTDPPGTDFNSTADSYGLSYTEMDVGLGLPMFLRLYLFGRFILFRSRLVRNVSLRSFGYLNRVSVDFFFLIKTCLEQWPGRCLLTFCTIVFLIGSWALRACDHQSNNEHISMPNAMWLFIITFTTVGYGDIYPSSYCGRSIATLTGLVGLLTSALLIAVLAQKLLLTRSEKYVHTFVLNTELAKQRRHYAANVVKFSIQVWYIRRQNRSGSLHCLNVQRKLFRSISSLQETKQGQKKLLDNCVGLHELMTLQQNLNLQYEQSASQMSTMESSMKQIESQLNFLARNMDAIQISLRALIEHREKQTETEREAVFRV